jgi:GPH family glycoside/pentoside/hexuronide:cation symporter
VNAAINVPLAPRHWLAYGALGLPLAMAALPVYVHVPRFYAETAGMDLALLGVILLGARLLDAGIDPWIGWLADRAAPAAWWRWPCPALRARHLSRCSIRRRRVSPWLAGALALTYFGYSAATVAYQAWGADTRRDAPPAHALTAAAKASACSAWSLPRCCPACSPPTRRPDCRAWPGSSSPRSPCWRD